MRIHVCSHDEIVFGSLRAKVYYVLDEIFHVAYLIRDATDNLVEQSYFVAMFLAYIGDVNYGGNRLSREIKCGMYLIGITIVRSFDWKMENATNLVQSSPIGDFSLLC